MQYPGGPGGYGWGSGYPGQGGVPRNYGREDLDPLAWPNGGRGGGMIMDPRDLIPNPPNIREQDPRFPPGAIPPQARFDPIGPNGPYYPVRPAPRSDPFDPTDPTRTNQWYGPNSDDFRPPGWNDYNNY